MTALADFLAPSRVHVCSGDHVQKSSQQSALVLGPDELLGNFGQRMPCLRRDGEFGWAMPRQPRRFLR